MSLFELAELLFGVRRPVSRGVYAGAGFGLLVLRYGVDFALSAKFAEHAIDPFSYLNPVLAMRLDALGKYPSWLPVVMAVWALPFIWIGVSMTARRLADAGKSPWLALLFFVPAVNYLLMLGLCVARSVPVPTRAVIIVDAAPMLKAALLAVLGGVAFGLLAVALSVFGLETYGSVLFLGAPFTIGLISGALLNRERRQTARATNLVALLAVSLCGGALMVFALEGALCLAMAAVLALPLAILGAHVGRASVVDRRATGAMVVGWPLLAVMPWDRPTQFPIRAVVSTIEIDAPPTRVWPNVIGFSDLPAPSEWLLKTGIACPLRAHIEGQGVGSVRYCEFSTGPFVEPITAWDPPNRLAFDVAKQPPSMREWSPYEVVHAPHVVGGMQSLHGEFRITALPNGRSRLRGTTWYRLKMSPGWYWGLYADEIVHVIHLRVLKHIGGLSEAPG